MIGALERLRAGAEIETFGPDGQPLAYVWGFTVRSSLGPLDQYEQRGFGLYRVSLRSTGDIVGMNGLVTRPEFDRPDLGFAFLKSHWSRGYAYEASVAIVDYARRSLGLHSIIAMADEDNGASVHLLRKLGFQLLRRVTMPGETDEVLQFELVL